MVRPVRNKKPVNYSQHEDSDSDDDFLPAPGPLSKKSRTALKERPRKDSPKAKSKALQKGMDAPQEETPKHRVPLDDKIFQRGLETALALSARELPTVPGDGQARGDQDLARPPEEGGGAGGAPRVLETRKAACASAAQTRQALAKGSDGDSTDTSGSDGLSGEDGEGSEFSESEDTEDTDGDFTVTKSRGKAAKGKEAKARPPPEKRAKTQPEGRVAVTPVVPSPAAVTLEAQPRPSKGVLSPKAPRTPARSLSPPAEGKRPAWVPPAPSGSSSSRPAGGSARSPPHSLRLGLSRLARVKPLHPGATSGPRC